MPYPSHVKALAHKLDPECWKSYSGQPIEVKREIDVRRLATLKRAAMIDAKRVGRKASSVHSMDVDRSMSPRSEKHSD